MTRHNATQTGLMTPSPLDRWINALLRCLAMLTSHAASILCSMRLIRPAPECHSEATPEALPCRTSGKLKDTTKAAAGSHTSPSSNAREALILRTKAQGAFVDSKASRRDGRVARGELTGAAPRLTKATPAMPLPRAGEARRALAGGGARSGGGPPSRPYSAEEATATPVPHRTAHAATPALVSLPRSGEEYRGCFSS